MKEEEKCPNYDSCPTRFHKDAPHIENICSTKRYVDCKENSVKVENTGLEKVIRIQEHDNPEKLDLKASLGIQY